MRQTFIFSVGIAFFLAAFSRSANAEAVKVLPSPLSSGQVAFTLKDGKQSDILIIDFATQKVRELVASPVDDEYPVWSPDGKELLFYSDMSGDREIYVVNSDGSNLRRLTQSPGIDEDPDWSPDGKQIVFRSERGGNSNIYIMNADGSGVKQLTTSSKTNTVPKWSPKKNEVLYSTNASWPGWDIMYRDITSGTEKQQTSGIRTFCHAAWKPDGSGFSYSHGGSQINLFMKPIDGDEVQLTDYKGKDYDAIWKGPEQLIFVREMTKGKDDYQLFLLDIPSKATTRLTENTGELREPSWTAAAAPSGTTQVIRAISTP